MLPDEDRDALRDVLAHAEEALQAARNHNRSDLDEERLLYLGFQRLVEIVGEAASRVSAETREEHPHLPWRGMIDMRNRLIHGYEVVNADIVWETLTIDLPVLVHQLRAILADAEPPSPDDNSPRGSAPS